MDADLGPATPALHRIARAWPAAMATADAMRSAIAALPAHERNVFLLVTLEGMRYADVAAALDLPVADVASRMASARIAFSAAMARSRRP